MNPDVELAPLHRLLAQFAGRYRLLQFRFFWFLPHKFTSWFDLASLNIGLSCGLQISAQPLVRILDGQGALRCRDGHLLLLQLPLDLSLAQIEAGR